MGYRVFLEYKHAVLCRIIQEDILLWVPRNGFQICPSRFRIPTGRFCQDFMIPLHWPKHGGWAARIRWQACMIRSVTKFFIREFWTILTSNLRRLKPKFLWSINKY